MRKQPELILTPEEIAEAKNLTLVGLLIFGAMVAGFQWVHHVEREQERRTHIAPAR